MTDATSDDGSRGFYWPDVPRLAFGPGADPMVNARLDWVFQDEDASTSYYLAAYRAATDAVYERVLEGRMVVEYAVLPLAFLHRHRTELLLKAVVRAGRRLLFEAPPAKERAVHDLLKLWEIARPYVEPLGPPGAPELDNVAATLRELATIDKGADGFRYSTGVKGDSSLAAAPRMVNIVNLYEALRAVENFLEAVHGDLRDKEQFFLGEEFDLKRDGGAATKEQKAAMRRRYLEEHRRR